MTFLYDELSPVQELAGGLPAATLMTGLGIDEFLVRTDALGGRSFLTDALGSTMALADSAGAVLTEYTYEPFGAFTTSGAGTGNPFAFTGREVDGTGSMYYRARYYDPQRQRFLTQDPLGIVGGVNLFAYAANRPTLLIDRLGLKPSPDFGPGGGAGPGGGGGGNRGGPPPSPREPDSDRPPDDRCPGGPDKWFKDPSHGPTLGREGYPVFWPGSPEGTFLENYVPAAHAFATRHDVVVDMLKSMGVPDIIANGPTMPAAYYAELRNQINRSFGQPYLQLCH